MFPFAAFLGSFLLFLIQPMAAKSILPNFGGSASVWTSALLFFQLSLLLGYAYAAFAPPRLHAVVLPASLLTLFFPAAIATVHTGSPTLDVLATLSLRIGLPFAAIAAGSTLLQRWAGTYRLYAVSNTGSLAALLAYPVVFEPIFDLPTQSRLWTAGTILYALAIAWCIRTRRTAALGTAASVRPPLRDLLWWTAWSAAGAGLLAATTNQICQEIASIPFLWIVPLAIYLLTFIWTFASPRASHPTPWSILAPLAFAAAVILFVLGPQAAIIWHLIGDLATLLVALMLCHGQLANSRPHESSLGWFYLAISLGGVLGGLFTAIVAPAVFKTYAEFPLLLAAIGMLALVHGMTSGRLLESAHPFLNRVQIFGLSIAAIVPIAVFAAEAPGTLEERRNFYGTLRITERNYAQGPLRTFTHGQTIHGTQWTEHREWPTTYYSENSGIARSLREVQQVHPHGIHAGLIGLGAATLAHYAGPRDRFVFFELNPDVEALARKHFRYLATAEGQVRVILGDARTQLREFPEGDLFDLLAIDAFSSDSIPVHLLTLEAARIYARRTKPEGLILIHISNRALHLEPVARGIARALNRKFELLRSDDEPSIGANAALWVRLSPGAYEGPPGILWTDAHSSLWSIFKIEF